MRLILDDLDVGSAAEVMLGERALDRRRQPEHEASLRDGRLHLHRGIAHYRKQADDLLVAAARQEAEDQRALVDAKPASRLVTGGRRPDLIEERVADELDRHAGAPIQGRLERKDGEYQRDESSDGPHPPSAPRPNLRWNEVHDGNTGAPCRAGQEQAEPGEVDQHEHGRTRLPAKRGPKLTVRAVETRYLADRLAPAHHRVRRHIHEEIHTGGSHARAAHPVEPPTRLEISQRAAQAGSVKVTGGLAGDEHDRLRPAGHHSTPTRAMPAPSATRRHASRSRMSTRPASSAMTAAPPAAAISIVSGPTVGMSKR